MMMGPTTKFLLSALSKRQTAVSHSTPEAAIVAGPLALPMEAIPQMELWDKLLGRGVYLDFAEKRGEDEDLQVRRFQ